MAISFDHRGPDKLVGTDANGLTLGGVALPTLAFTSVTGNTGTASADNAADTIAITGVNGLSTAATDSPDGLVISPTYGAPVNLGAANSAGTANTFARSDHVHAYPTAANVGALADSGANGIVVRTAANTTTARTLTAGTGITITNADGVAGNPTITNNDLGSAQQIFKNIAVSGQSTVVADNNDDTLKLVGNGVTITTDAATDTITFSTTAGALTQINDDNTDATRYLLFVDGTGNQSSKIDSVTGALTYNPGQGLLGVGKILTTGDVTVGGNLIVNGSTTTVNSTTVTIDDPVFTLGGDTAPTTDDNKDRGIEFRWHNGTAAKVGFFGFDDSTGFMTFIPDATNTSEVFSGAVGVMDVSRITGSAASLTTARTITLSGDVGGSVSFDGSANVTITTTIQPNSVALGTDTTGNYVATATAGTGISITGSGVEGAALTITNTDTGSAQNIFKNIAVSGQSTCVADNNNDTLTLVAGGGLTITTDAATDTITFTQKNGLYFTESRSVTAPNATIPAHAFTVSGAEADIDHVVGVKGLGSLLVDVPDNAAAGGNKRGNNAVDLQHVRAAADQVASGNGSVIVGGANNQTNGAFSAILGGQFATTAGLTGAVANGFNGSVIGQNQRLEMGLRVSTTGTTATRATADGAAASATNQYVLRNNSAARFFGHVVARDTTTGDTKFWDFQGGIKRGANATATAIVGSSSVNIVAEDTAAATWTIGLLADTTNGSLAVNVTGAGTNAIRWTVVVTAIEVA